MIINEGNLDRAFRSLIGLLLFVSGFWNSSWVGYVSIGIGIVLLSTGLMGWCPLYSLLGINTRTKSK